MLRSWLAMSLASVAILYLDAFTAGAAAQDRTGPRLEAVTVHSRPQRGDTYSAGNAIRVGVVVRRRDSASWDRPTRELMVGDETRSMQFDECRGCGGAIALVFEYIVRATDYDPDGIGVASDALSLNGARVTDLAGNPPNLNLGRHAFGNDPAHKVDGRADPAPVVKELRIDSTPGTGDTYVQGETIDVFVYFDEHITVSGTPRLALTVGTDTRFAEFRRSRGQDRRVRLRSSTRCGRATTTRMALSIPANALRLNGGRIRDRTGNDADTSLSDYAVTDHPHHRVGRASGERARWLSSSTGARLRRETTTHTWLGNEIGVYIGVQQRGRGHG